LPELVEEAASRRTADLRLDAREDYSGCDPVAVEGCHAFVPIMRGCDRFCTFCVVPLTRGREKSLPLPEVVRQAEGAVARGARALTLLGQTVNSYRCAEHTFTDLLDAVSRLPGLLRVRFTSPHPCHFHRDHFRLLSERPALCPHLHLPVQSGSDRMLAAMKRGYTRADFLALVESIRAHLPEAGLTTDVIVGFPGETEEDFEATLSLMRAVEFDSAFLFRYSERPGTYAARHQPDDVPLEAKAERLDRVIALQEEISLRRYRRLVGREVEVLVEGPSRRDPAHAVGKSADGKTVILPAGPEIGALARVRIASATSHSLQAQGVGRLEEPEGADTPSR
jgi:tRNA-2-methylthio-N6-dimethylallyladenosine synthase